ncbi:MAG: hypothetical protein ACRDZO_10605 [Egibacteraceae bacterium]
MEDPYSLEPLPLPPWLPLGDLDDDPRPCSLLRHLRDMGVKDDRVAARLWAVHDIGKLLKRWGPELERRRSAVITAFEAAQASLAELRRLRTLGEAADARRAVTVLERRHAGDGPEDRRSRLWPAWVPWVVVGGAGLFETWFFGQIFRFVSNVDTSTVAGRIGALVSYVPGMMLAVTVALAGALLGEPLVRWKDKKEGRPTAEPRPIWWVAAPFAVCLLVVVGLLALARANFLRGTEEASLVPEWSVILLMLMVTVGAVVVKAVTHNPFAATARRAQRDLDEAYKTYQVVQDEVGERLAAHKVAWHGLQAVYLEVRGGVQNIAVVRSYAYPPGSGGAPRIPPVGQGDLLRLGAEDMLAQLEQTADPQPALGLLSHVEHVLANCRPEPLDQERRALVDEIDGQFAVARDDPTATP